MQQLVAKLQEYPDDTVVTIRDVAEVEFLIARFEHGTNGLVIVINDREEEDDQDEQDE